MADAVQHRAAELRGVKRDLHRAHRDGVKHVPSVDEREQARKRLEAYVRSLDDADVLLLHRIASRHAHRVRQRDPIYRMNWQTGVAAARAKSSAGKISAVAIRGVTSEGQ